MTKVLLILVGALVPAHTSTQPRVTLAPHGPFQVAATHLLDAKGRTFEFRGTQLPAFHPQTVAHYTRSAPDFEPHSAT